MKELSQAIVTRAEAQAQGLTRYFTGVPCKHGHICERKTCNSGCVECDNASSRKAYAANPEKEIARADAWRRANIGKKRAINSKWRRGNQEQIKAYEALPARREASRRQAREWAKNNPGRASQRHGKRRVREAGTSVELTPHQQHQVNQIYLLMTRLTLATGTQYHVDHFIPVTKGGSHAPENLWVVPAEQNKRKGTKLPVVAKVDSV